MTADFKQVEKILKEQEIPKADIELYRALYTRFLEQKKKPLVWKEIETPKEGQILDYVNLAEPAVDQVSALLSKLAVCRLNGGLGTSMGCVGPKSAIEVRDGATFMDLAVTQIKILNEKYGVQVPLVLMNSQSTELDTKKIIQKYSGDLQIHTFKQNWLPRLRKDSLMPVSKARFGEESFYPPGHGDFYDSFPDSGILDQLIQEGKEWIFVANSDNLGVG